MEDNKDLKAGEVQGASPAKADKAAKATPAAKPAPKAKPTPAIATPAGKPAPVAKPKPTPAAKPEPKEKAAPVAKAAPKALHHQLMDQHNVDTLHENSKGEYFTSLNLAINSEDGVKDRVKTHTKEA